MLSCVFFNDYLSYNSVFASENMYFGRTTSLACTAICAYAKSVVFPRTSRELVCVLLPSLSRDTSLLGLIVIFSISFFNYTFKRKLILQDMKKKNQGNTMEIPFSPIKVVSFFLPFPSSPSPAISQ